MRPHRPRKDRAGVCRRFMVLSGRRIPAVCLCVAVLVALGCPAAFAQTTAPPVFGSLPSAAESVEPADDAKAVASAEADDKYADAILARMVLKKEDLPDTFRLNSETRCSHDVIRRILGKAAASMTAGMIAQELVPVAGMGVDKRPLARDAVRLRLLAPFRGMQQELVAELVKHSGEGSTVFRFNDGVVQITGTREAQEQALGLFRLSETETVKVKGAFLDTSLQLLAEEPIHQRALRELGRMSGTNLLSGVIQTLWRHREIVQISYYETESPMAAALLQSYLANTPIGGSYTFAQKLSTVVVQVKGSTPSARNAAVRALWGNRSLKMPDAIKANRMTRFIPPGR